MSTPSISKTPTNKKIAKAAKAGGSRARSRSNVSWSYWGSVIGICVLGIALVVGSAIGKSVAESAPFAASISDKLKSANSQLQKLQSAKKPDAKKILAATKKRDEILGDTHWHSAYGIYKCDAYQGKIVGGAYKGEIDATTFADEAGIHAHDDGLIHIHPFLKRSAGRNATLGWFLDAVKMTINSDEITWPDAATGKDITLKVGKDTCGKDKKEAEVSIYVWRDIKKPGRVERYTGDFRRIPLLKNGAYAFAFTAKGAKTPGIPPSEKALENPADLPSPVSTIPGAATTTAPAAGATTTAPAAGATTTAPAAGATTTAPASSSAPTTTAPAATTAVPTTTKA